MQPKPASRQNKQQTASPSTASSTSVRKAGCDKVRVHWVNKPGKLVAYEGHVHKHRHTHILSLCHTHTHTHAHARTHTHTHSHKHTLTHSHINSHG
jgi:hypothetical protein